MEQRTATALLSESRNSFWSRYSGALFLLAPLLVFLIIFYVIPFANMLRESFQYSSIDAQTGEGLTLHQYLKTWSSARIGRVMERTFRMSLLTVAITLILSYPIALLLLRLKSSIRTIIFISLASSLIVRNYGWVVVLADKGALNSLIQALGLMDKPLRLMYSEVAIVIGLVHFSIPFMVLPIYSSLLRQPSSLKEASLSLGGSAWQTFSKITLPLSLPGVFGGTVLTFALSMSAYVTPLMLGSPSSSMISQVAAEQLLIQLNFPYGAAIIVTLTALTFLIVAAYATLLRKVFRADV
jgi:putative spermidine/putrescine transport system permease protein